MTEFVYQWENLSVKVEKKSGWLWKSVKQKKVLLNNVSGEVESNSLIAVIGESGSGKSTLLRVLSGDFKGNIGTIKLNNSSINKKMIKDICGFMPQHDTFTETLTVLEHLRFVTALTRKVDKKLAATETIKNILYELDLEKQEHTYIRVLSGGEKRRLSMASELVNDPYILLCDEPITGLDSSTAMRVIHKLEATAVSGRAVLITIHQPSSQIFNLFNNIILLANGRLIFQGTCENAKKFFEKQNLICPPMYNPADFYLKTMKSEKIAKISEKNYIIYKKNNIDYKPRYNEMVLEKRQFERSFFFQFKWLLWRDYLDNKRDVSIFQFCLVLITSLLVAICYSLVTVGTINTIQSIQGVIYILASELIYEQMYKVIYIFPKEMNIFVREKQLYSACPYYLSKLCSLMPCCFMYSFVYAVVYFSMLSFFTGLTLFMKFLVILFVSSLSGASLGLCASAIFPSTEYSNLFLVPFQQCCMIFSGLWIKISSLTKLFAVLKFLSPFYFSYDSLCNVYWLEVTNIANCTNVTNGCFESGVQVLDHYGLSTDQDASLWNMAGLTAVVSLFCVLGFISIIRKRDEVFAI